MKKPPSKDTHNQPPTFFFMYWPGCPNVSKTDIPYHQKPLNAGLGIQTGHIVVLLVSRNQYYNVVVHTTKLRKLGNATFLSAQCTSITCKEPLEPPSSYSSMHSLHQPGWQLCSELKILLPFSEKRCMYLIELFPPIHLYLISKISSSKNLVQRTGFFVYFELDFCRLHRQ